MNTKKNDQILIIAEAGVNHNGSTKNIKKLIDIASSAKADYVKFQSFIAKNLVTKDAKKAKYQQAKNNKSETQFELLKKLELSRFQHRQIIKYCKVKKIKPLFTPFDEDSLNYLRSLKVKELKIGSSDLNNIPFLEKISKLNKIVFLSTGMSNLNEISLAIRTLTKNRLPKKKIYVLHCNTDYPTKFVDVNLNAMIQMKKKFNIKVGYSDHTLGIEVPVAAAALGASVIEKHFTINKHMIGPDHKASLSSSELIKMVIYIRNIEKSLGSNFKKVTVSEKRNIAIVRKSIVAKTLINKGELFSLKNITIKRPGTGIKPEYLQKILGKRAIKSFKKDELIKIK